MRELATPVEVRTTAPGRHLRHRRRRRAHLQHLDLRRHRPAAAAGAKGGEAHGPLSVVVLRQRRGLEALGANIALTPAQTGQALDKLGLGFMLAPAHHAAMKHAAPVRRSSACAPSSTSSGAHQSGRREEPGDGRVSIRISSAPGAVLQRLARGT